MDSSFASYHFSSSLLTPPVPPRAKDFFDITVKTEKFSPLIDFARKLVLHKKDLQRARSNSQSHSGSFACGASQS